MPLEYCTRLHEETDEIACPEKRIPGIEYDLSGRPKIPTSSGVVCGSSPVYQHGFILLSDDPRDD